MVYDLRRCQVHDFLISDVHSAGLRSRIYSTIGIGNNREVINHSMRFSNHDRTFLSVTPSWDIPPPLQQRSPYSVLPLPAYFLFLELMPWTYILMPVIWKLMEFFKEIPSLKTCSDESRNKKRGGFWIKVVQVLPTQKYLFIYFKY